MQTWAKRGVQAALVTGGMLAVGTGVATASETCPERPTPPLGESVIPPVLDEPGDDTVPADRCFAGELMPESSGTQYNAPLVDSRTSHSVTALTGTLDPVHDLLPAVENELTQEMPALRDEHWHTQSQTVPLHLAGWVADPADARPLDTVPGMPPLGSDRPVTPAEGFHRSLSWAGPIGEVIQGGANTLDKGAFRTGAILDVPADLVIPHDELVYFDGFAPANGIVELWEDALSRGQGLVVPEQADLTSAEVPGLHSQVHGVPREVVARALTAVAPEPTPRADFMPLEVPGEHQMQANEVPDLGGLTLIDLSRAPGTAQRSETPGVVAPLPVLGEFKALDSGQASVPPVSRITAALDGTNARDGQRAFTHAPLNSDVAVQVVDEMAAPVPAEQVVTQNPFRPVPEPRTESGMALPVLGSGVPDISAVHGESLATPGVNADHTLRTLENADTVVLDRI
jgi:hypothetical protein